MPFEFVFNLFLQIVRGQALTQKHQLKSSSHSRDNSNRTRIRSQVTSKIRVFSSYKFIISMSQKPPPISSFLLPSLDKIPQGHLTLKLINTLNNLPHQPSLENIEIPVVSPEDDSLGERISLVQTAANSGKKRKIGCTCKKTFCLKMYCECFAGGKQCGQDCACVNCKNSSGCEEAIREAKRGIKEGGVRNCRLSEKRCNCKKSHCLKRYCECYNSGVGCSKDCKCQNCQNQNSSPFLQPPSPEEEIEENLEKSELQKDEMVPIQFPSMNGYHSMQDLQKFYK